MEDKGVIFHVNNNDYLDYCTQANISSMLVKHYLDLPVTVVCSRSDADKIDSRYVDNIINLESTPSIRAYTDTYQSVNRMYWYNRNRFDLFEIAPYKKNLILDTDYLVQNCNLLELFNTNYTFAANCISERADGEPEFLREVRLGQAGPPLYWATALYFRKTEWTYQLFKLCRLVRDNWYHFLALYNISHSLYRNDYALSIAIHIMNSNENISVPALPCAQINCYPDEDLLAINYGSIIGQSKHRLYRIARRNIHIMNKTALVESADRFREVYNDRQC